MSSNLVAVVDNGGKADNNVGGVEGVRTRWIKRSN
jgi:hypothetical protein